MLAYLSPAGNLGTPQPSEWTKNNREAGAKCTGGGVGVLLESRRIYAANRIAANRIHGEEQHHASHATTPTRDNPVLESTRSGHVRCVLGQRLSTRPATR